MKKTALILIVLTLISKVIGFVREIILSYFYGTSSISDAYLISLIIPTVIFTFIGSAISTSFIPTYNRITKEEGIERARWYTNNIFNILIIICTFIVIFFLIFADPIVKLFASGFDEETLALAVSFSKVTIIGIYFTALVYLLNSFLQVKGNYIIPALIGLPMNFIMILSVFISSKGNISLLAIGVVVAVFCQLLFITPSVLKKGFKYQFVLNLKDPQIKNMFVMAIPVLLGVAVNDINKIVDKTLASQIATGGISALTYATTLNNVVQGVFVLSLVTVMYPLISRMVIDGNISGLKKSLSETLNLVLIFVTPMTVGIMIFSEPIIKFLFGRGAFDENSIQMTSDALFFYSLGMIAFGFREVLSRPFYALGDTKTPMINATIGVVINIVLNFILSKYLGIGGLALATSIAAFITTGMMLYSLRKKIGSLDLKSLFYTFAKIFFSTLIMGSGSYFFFEKIKSYCSDSISLIMAAIVGVVIYTVIIYFMKLKDVETFINLIKNRSINQKKYNR